MTSGDVGRAVDAARALLDTLPDTLVYHGPDHTLFVVLPAAERYAAVEGLDEDTHGLVTVAAAFHDTGMLERYRGHEEVSARFAERAMRPLGFTAEEIAAVRGMIRATRLPQRPRNLAERVMADADLDILGRDDFIDSNQRLHQELALVGIAIPDGEWYAQQALFLRSHSYFTAAARALRDPGKRANLERLEALAHRAGSA